MPDHENSKIPESVGQSILEKIKQQHIIPKQNGNSCSKIMSLG
jgi:hypothetical protein